MLKALFERYIDMATWHRPSVIVLDNLDSVISAEAEVRPLSVTSHLVSHLSDYLIHLLAA